MSSHSISSQQPEHKQWTRGEFYISTDKSLLSLSAINAAFEADFMYWTTRIPDDVLQQIIDGSFCFGMYTGFKGSAERRQVGFARLITDNTTFAYLTDVYVLPEFQGTGLGGWLLDCIDQHLSEKPYLRWSMLRTSSERSRDAYEKRLGMTVLESGQGAGAHFMMGKRGAHCMS